MSAPYEVTAAEVTEMLREALPAGSATCEITAVEAIPRGEDIIAVLRVVC